MSNDHRYVSVLAMRPFWRYAVGPASACSPAIPFYTKAAAEAFFEEAKVAVPFFGVIIYKRRFLSRTITTEQEYTPPSK